MCYVITNSWSFYVFSRQVIEIDFLNRKVDLVHNDSIANREDVARMISELTLKVMLLGVLDVT